MSRGEEQINTMQIDNRKLASTTKTSKIERDATIAKLKVINVPITVTKLKNDSTREQLYNEMISAGVKEKDVFDLIEKDKDLSTLFGDVNTQTVSQIDAQNKKSKGVKPKEESKGEDLNEEIRHEQILEALQELKKPKEYYENKKEHDAKLLKLLENIPELKEIITETLRENKNLMQSNTLLARELQVQLTKIQAGEELSNQDCIKVSDQVESLSASKDPKKQYSGNTFTKVVEKKMSRKRSTLESDYESDFNQKTSGTQVQNNLVQGNDVSANGSMPNVQSGIQGATSIKTNNPKQVFNIYTGNNLVDDPYTEEQKKGLESAPKDQNFSYIQQQTRAFNSFPEEKKVIHKKILQALKDSNLNYKQKGKIEEILDQQMKHANTLEDLEKAKQKINDEYYVQQSEKTQRIQKFTALKEQELQKKNQLVYDAYNEGGSRSEKKFPTKEEQINQDRKNQPVEEQQRRIHQNKVKEIHEKQKQIIEQMKPKTDQTNKYLSELSKKPPMKEAHEGRYAEFANMALPDDLKNKVEYKAHELYHQYVASSVQPRISRAEVGQSNLNNPPGQGQVFSAVNQQYPVVDSVLELDDLWGAIYDSEEKSKQTSEQRELMNGKYVDYINGGINQFTQDFSYIYDEYHPVRQQEYKQRGAVVQKQLQGNAKRFSEVEQQSIDSYTKIIEDKLKSQVAYLPLGASVLKDLPINVRNQLPGVQRDALAKNTLGQAKMTQQKTYIPGTGGYTIKDIVTMVYEMGDYISKISGDINPEQKDLKKYKQQTQVFGPVISKKEPTQFKVTAQSAFKTRSC